jgi:hypothetical protein
MAKAAFDPLRAGRGLAAPMARDANDLAHASARAGFHRGAPTQHDGFRLRTAALAQNFGYGWHRGPRPEVLHTPLRTAHTRPRYNGPGLGALALSAKSALALGGSAQGHEAWQRGDLDGVIRIFDEQAVTRPDHRALGLPEERSRPSRESELGEETPPEIVGRRAVFAQPFVIVGAAVVLP